MNPQDTAVQPLTEQTGLTPGTVHAVHLSYLSRAQQRGRIPATPSYFMKSAGSLAGNGVVVRPEGTELLAFEGEIVAVIGTEARNVTPEDGWKHIGWITAGNDLGIHDVKYADKGSNLRMKSGDGYSPLGPNFIPADKVRPDGIGVRTWLDGEVVQDDSTAGMLFPIGLMVADLSRFMTLHPGDMIFTGTPAGSTVAEPGQRIEVEVFSLDDPSITSGRLITDVVSGPALAEWGDQPKVTDAAREGAVGQTVPAKGKEEPAPFVLTDEIRERLKNVAVATISAQLRQRGYETVSIDGVRSLNPGQKIVGTARTLRYIPFRKDLFAAKGGGYNAQKRAMDSVNEGEVLVMEARGVDDAGTLGDILALRAKVRGCAGIITDGCARDYSLVADINLPVFAAGPHPAVLGRRHVPWETDVDISCGGATIQVGDVIVADDDGPLVIPPHLVMEVLEAAEQQEDEETFIAEMVQAGESVDGLYPLGKNWRPRYEEWRASKNSN